MISKYIHNGTRGKNRITWLASAIAIIFTLISAPVSGAQNPPAAIPPGGTLQGTVTHTDDQGQLSAVQGVQLKLTPESGSAALATVTDDHGHYSFTGLSVGNYTLEGTLEGFESYKVVLKVADVPLVQDFTMKLSAVTQSVEINAEAEAMSTQNANSNATITAKQSTDVPLAEQKFKEALPLVPGVVRASNGTLNMKGTTESQGMLLVDSAETVDPVTGSFSIPVPLGAIDTLSVSKTPYGAQYGGFSGGLAVIETKPPSDTWKYDVEDFFPTFRGKNDHLVGIQYFKPRALISGPLIKKKLNFTEAFDYDFDRKPIRGLPWPLNEIKTQGFDSFTSFQSIISPRNVLNGNLIVFTRHQRFADINSLVPQTASTNDGQKGFSMGATDSEQFQSGVGLSTLLRFTRIESNANPQGTADMVLTPDGREGDFFNTFARTAGQFQLQPIIQLPAKKWLGHHDIKFGADFTHRYYSGTSESHPVQIFRQDGTLAEEIDFLPGSLLHSTDTEVSEFIEDNWTISDHVTIDLGARLVSQSAGRAAGFGPRAGLAFSPGHDHKTLIHLGSGIFYDRVPLLTTDFTDNPTRVVALFGPTGLPLGPPTVFTNVYLAPGPGGTLVPTITRPNTSARNLTSSAEVDRDLGRNTVLRLSFLSSQIQDYAVVIPIQGALGGNSYLGLANTGSSHYYELEATVNYKLSERHVLSASYIHSYGHGDLNAVSSIFVPFEQAIIRPNVSGVLPANIPDRLVTWGIFSFPWKLKVAPVVDYHTGLPYSVIDSLQNYVGTPNSERFPNFFSLDVKLYREFKVHWKVQRFEETRTVRLGVYSLNLTNHANPLDVFNNNTSPLFGQFDGFQHRIYALVVEFKQ
jgi:TonB dependent receptor/Carboxypeptidase regulatory-like domain